MNEKNTQIVALNSIELQSNPNSMQKSPAFNNDFKEELEDPNEDIQKKPQILVKTEYMPIPKRLICFSITFLVIGIVFLSIGLNDYFNAIDDRARAMSFLIFGCLMFVPGIYYVYQVYSACIAGSPEEREEILSDIPNIQF